MIAELVPIATKLRAVIIAEGPNSTDTDTAISTKIVHPASARVAGVIAKSDAERGFWHSPSNRLIDGIVGTARPIDFTLGDATSRANILNENEVATIIQRDGYRLWGNRTASSDAK